MHQRTAIALTAVVLSATSIALGVSVASWKMSMRPPAVRYVERTGPVTIKETKVAFEQFCKINASGEVPMANGMRHDDARDCFSMEHPSDWVQDDPSLESFRYRLFAPGTAADDITMISNPNVSVERVKDAGVEKYAEYLADGYREVRPGLLATDWLDYVHGDGSVAPKSYKQYAFFEPRGVYEIWVSNTTAKKIDHAELEKIAATFKAL